jgi:hypothetical protein
MKLVSRIEINNRTAEVAARGDTFAKALALVMAHEAAHEARQNVAPGKGPGPHPHKPGSNHIDTGHLMRNIEVEPQDRGFLKTATVFTEVPYGTYLEIGWINPHSGNFWRYPWLWPAVQVAQANAPGQARSTARQFFFNDAGLRIPSAFGRGGGGL